MRSTSRCADCWTCLTLLAPLDPASTGRDRVRVVSMRRVFLFVVVSFYLDVHSYLWKRINLKNCHVRKPSPKEATDRLLSLGTLTSEVRVQHVMFFFATFCYPFFCSSIKICTIIDDDWSDVRATKKTVIHIYIHVQLALLLPLCVLLVLLSLFLLRKRPFAVSQQSTWTSSSIIIVLYDARRTSMHSYIPACCCAVCCYTAVDAAADDVRHRVPDCKIRFRGSLHLIPVFFSFHLNKIYFQCTPWHYCRILSVHFFPYNSYHTS